VSDEKIAAYLWYPRDFAADEHVLMMNLAQEGAYRRLLDHQWLHGSIPASLGELARLCRGQSPQAMKRLWGGIQPCFQPLPGKPGRLVNPKMERVRAEAAEFRANRQAAGRLGGLAASSKRVAQLEQEGSTATAELKPPTATPSPSPTPGLSQSGGPSYHTRCIVALNRAIQRHPDIKHPREISGSEMQGVVSWESDGISLDVVETVIRDTMARYRVTADNPQPHSLLYFDRPVRKAWESAKQRTTMTPAKASISLLPKVTA
jgi:hypothetical protein